MGQAGKTDSQMAIERQRLNSLRRRMEEMSRIEEEAKQRKADGPRGGDSDDETNTLNTIAKNQALIFDRLTSLQIEINHLKEGKAEAKESSQYSKRVELALEIVRVLGNHQGSDKQELVGLAVMVLRDEITPLVLVKPDLVADAGTFQDKLLSSLHVPEPVYKGPIITHDPTLKTYEEGVAQKYPLKEVPSW